MRKEEVRRPLTKFWKRERSVLFRRGFLKELPLFSWLVWCEDARSGTAPITAALYGANSAEDRERRWRGTRS